MEFLCSGLKRGVCGGGGGRSGVSRRLVRLVALSRLKPPPPLRPRLPPPHWVLWFRRCPTLIKAKRASAVKARVPPRCLAPSPHHTFLPHIILTRIHTVIVTWFSLPPLFPCLASLATRRPFTRFAPTRNSKKFDVSFDGDLKTASSLGDYRYVAAESCAARKGEKVRA